MCAVGKRSFRCGRFHGRVTGQEIRWFPNGYSPWRGLSHKERLCKTLPRPSEFRREQIRTRVLRCRSKKTASLCKSSVFVADKRTKNTRKRCRA